MAISNLISKIKANSYAEVDVILEKAAKEEKEILHKRIDVEAKHESDAILEKAKAEAKSKVDRIVSSTELKVRNEVLSAKQKMIEKVFDLALQKLSTLSADELSEFIKKSIFNTPFNGESSLILSKDIKEKMKPNFEEEVNTELKKLGRDSSIKISSEVRKTEGEFILSQKGIEINYTFKALVSSLKEEMEYDITKILFQ